MQRRYGSRLFKCNRFGCPSFRTGFESKPERDRHLRVHDRPYKCDRPNCDFADMGFASQARLNFHLHYHEKQAKKPVAHLADIDKNDVELIILDAVKADDVDLVRDFIADVPRFSRRLIKASVSSSCEMLDVFLNACNSELINEQFIESNLLDYAIEIDNLEATRMLLNRGASFSYWEEPSSKSRSISKAIQNYSPEMIKILLGDGYPQEMIANTVWFSSHLTWDLFHKLERSKEARLIQCLSLLPDSEEKKRVFQYLFEFNAHRYCSVDIAEFLLGNGVDIEYRRSSGNTALFYASKRKDQRAAELMKFLLESGADPLGPVTPKSKPIADQPGPRNISKWLGISWEQLVEESREKWAASVRLRFSPQNGWNYIRPNRGLSA